MNRDTQRLLKRLLAIATLFLIAALIIWTVQKKDQKEARDMVVTIERLESGHTLISEVDVKEKLLKSFAVSLVGLPLGAIDMERVEEVLEDDPFVLKAEAYVDAQNVVYINLKQREPLLRVIDDNGLNYYLDKEGRKMPTSKHFTANVMVANGNIPPYVEDYQKRRKHALRDLFELTNRILSDEFLQAMIEQIFVTDKGDYILTPILGNQKIIFGPYENIESKFFRLKAFYAEAVPYTGWKRYKTINLKFKNQVVCKKR